MPILIAHPHEQTHQPTPLCLLGKWGYVHVFRILELWLGMVVTLWNRFLQNSPPCEREKHQIPEPLCPPLPCSCLGNTAADTHGCSHRHPENSQTQRTDDGSEPRLPNALLLWAGSISSLELLSPPYPHRNNFHAGRLHAPP